MRMGPSSKSSAAGDDDDGDLVVMPSSTWLALVHPRGRPRPSPSKSSATTSRCLESAGRDDDDGGGGGGDDQPWAESAPERKRERKKSPKGLREKRTRMRRMMIEETGEVDAIHRRVDLEGGPGQGATVDRETASRAAAKADNNNRRLLCSVSPSRLRLSELYTHSPVLYVTLILSGHQ
ncbi:hypothetical protein TYRP_010381 [Tyrophagus putrescentiae]|nr:hypothetical protein TYRP_010381 [Tyrophagus putrescentiae]